MSHLFKLKHSFVLVVNQAYKNALIIDAAAGVFFCAQVQCKFKALKKASQHEVCKGSGPLVITREPLQTSL